MQNLFLISYTAHFNIAASTASNLSINTNSSYFEIEDDLNGNLQIHFIKNAGMARFNNSNLLDLTIFNYDKFLTSLSHIFQQGKKRCDLILGSASNDYIILGELKNRVYHSNVREGAVRQLKSSLETILDVADIKNYIDSKKNKLCCYFNKQSQAPPALSATNAFNRLSTLNTSGFQMSSPQIEALGFDFYEYTGEQTVQLI